MYKARDVSEAGFLLQQNMAGPEGVVVEDLEVWEVLVMVCPYEGSQKLPVETRGKQINQNPLILKNKNKNPTIIHNKELENCRNG